ncbi:MAG: PAS domain-containing protein, partial [Candidatus Lokiarchaeota archaeon]|nr:PAS domain-containing protein [Candidatus Lokiarchaeota archaeon]
LLEAIGKEAGTVIAKLNLENELKILNRELENKVKQRTHKLNERVKELRCLNDIQNLSQEREYSIEDIIKKTIERIVPAFQYPEITCVRFISQKKIYQTENFNETEWKLVSDVPLTVKPFGQLEVYYSKERPQKDIGPFLEEELDLINSIVIILSNLNQRLKAEQLLKDSKEFLYQITANVSGLIFQYKLSHDKKERFTFISEGIRDLMELKPESVMKDPKKLWAIYEKEAIPLLKEKIKDSAENMTPWHAEYQLRTAKRGKLKWVEGLGIPRKKENGDIIWNGWVRDISKQKESELQLEKALQDLKSSNAELEHFAYIASHDLQEPLRTISSFSQIIGKRLNGRLDETEDKYLGYIIDGTKRMKSLINDLLVFSRIKRKGNEFKSSDVERILNEVLKGLKSSIYENNAEITHDPLPTILADSSQIYQVLQNLISNSIKFRSEKPPKIHISAETTHNEWIFSIKDNGIGIDSKYFDRIFIAFQRLHSKTKYSGTGIGLAICKKIIKRHGGKIWIESEEGKGSTFFFSIPKKIVKFNTV